MDPRTLADSQPGQTYVIQSLNIADIALCQQLYAMGVMPGNTVTLIRRAPLGDPLQIEVLGTQLALRKTDAKNILVSSAEAESNGYE